MSRRNVWLASLAAALVASVAGSARADYCRTKACDNHLAYDDVWQTEPDAPCDTLPDGCRLEGQPLYWPHSCLSFSVQKDGSAARAGVEAGDVILKFDGRAINRSTELPPMVASVKPGAEVEVEVWRIAADESEFLQMLRRLADGGNTHVMYRLGRMHAAGIGGVRDEVEAVRWYRKAADAGNLSATAALAVALLEGRGTGIDQQGGLRLLRTAAAKDHLEAMNRLGHILADGKLADKDTLEAARLFTRAAEAGHAPSMVDIGLMYANGQGAAKNAVLACMWITRGTGFSSNCREVIPEITSAQIAEAEKLARDCDENCQR